MIGPGDVFETDAARRGARAAFGAARPDATSVEWRPLGRGNRKQTALATLADGDRVVVQVCATERLLRTERALLAAIDARTPVPVPTVEAATTVDAVTALVTTYIEAEDLHERFAGFDRSVQRRLAQTFGRSLAHLHETFRFERSGRVTLTEDPDDTTDAGDRYFTASDVWTAPVTSYGRVGLDRLPAEFDDLRGDLATLFDGAQLAADPPMCLFPWDFRPGNALVDGTDLVAVLDWESPLAAPPALSVAKAEYLVTDWYVDHPEPLRAAFRAGYDSVRPLPTTRPVHRAAAICQSAVDSNGVVTNPGYPELDHGASVSFHRRALEAVLADADGDE